MNQPIITQVQNKNWQIIRFIIAIILIIMGNIIVYHARLDIFDFIFGSFNMIFISIVSIAFAVGVLIPKQWYLSVATSISSCYMPFLFLMMGCGFGGGYEFCSGLLLIILMMAAPILACLLFGFLGKKLIEGIERKNELKKTRSGNL